MRNVGSKTIMQCTAAWYERCSMGWAVSWTWCMSSRIALHVSTNGQSRGHGQLRATLTSALPAMKSPAPLPRHGRRDCYSYGWLDPRWLYPTASSTFRQTIRCFLLLLVTSISQSVTTEMAKMIAQTTVAAHELDPLTSVHIAPSSKDYALSGSSSQERDRDGLARLGKKQVLKVLYPCARILTASGIDPW